MLLLLHHNHSVPAAEAGDGMDIIDDGVMLPDQFEVVMGCFAFGIFVVLNACERLSCLPVGRMGSSLVGAFLMITFGVVCRRHVLHVLGDNMPLLALVWGTMVLSHFLTTHGRLLDAVEFVCTRSSFGAWDSCIKLSLATSVLAAFLGWDIGALMLAPLALKIVQRHPGWPAKPFLAAVATGANAGSLLTPISNPGNVIVTLASGMKFTSFARKMFVPWVLAITINALVVFAAYAKPLLSAVQSVEQEMPRDEESGQANGSAESEDSTSEASTSEGCEAGNTSMRRLAGRKFDAVKRHWRGVWAYAVWALCLSFWFSDMELGAVALCGGVALIIGEWTDAAEPVMKSAEWPVIIYISGVLITVPSFNMTGVPAALWDWIVGTGAVSTVDFFGVLMLVFVISLFTNIVTNVPAVLLLSSRVAQLAVDEINPGGSIHDGSDAATRGWLSVALVAAMAGSLTVQGSITQVVAYDMGKAAPGGSVSFVEHLRVGIPVTVLTIACCLPVVLAEVSM